jgi:hypothetical protein
MPYVRMTASMQLLLSWEEKANVSNLYPVKIKYSAVLLVFDNFSRKEKLSITSGARLLDTITCLLTYLISVKREKMDHPRRGEFAMLELVLKKLLKKEIQKTSSCKKIQLLSMMPGASNQGLLGVKTKICGQGLHTSFQG